jgi:hypothetical protein
MKNIECTIYVSTKHGAPQIFRKGAHGWVLISGKGNVYPTTAEQVLSHVLPILAGKEGAKIKVVSDK